MQENKNDDSTITCRYVPNGSEIRYRQSIRGEGGGGKVKDLLGLAQP